MSIAVAPTALTLGFAALLSLALVGGSATIQDPVEVEIQAIQGKVSFLIGGIGNTVVSTGDDGLLVVDTKLARDGDALDLALGKVSEYLPSYVVNTHWHGDHTGNNARYGADARILAHENVRRRLAGDETIGGRVAKDTPRVALPDMTYREGASVHFNGEEIRLLHFPNAHTDGDTVVWFTGSKVVYMGDLYFQLGYPYIDVDSGGDVRGIIAGVERMLELAPEGTRFIPGHGVVTGPEELREYGEMLKTISGRVQELLEAGMSTEEIVAARPTEEFDERWGGFAFVPPEKIVQAIVAGYAQE